MSQRHRVMTRDEFSSVGCVVASIVPRREMESGARCVWQRPMGWALSFVVLSTSIFNQNEEVLTSYEKGSDELKMCGQDE